MRSAARPARRRASRVPTCRGDDFLPRGCRPNLRFFSLPTAPGQGKWAWKARVGRRGFGHPLKCSCIAVPNPAPSLAVSIVKALKNFQAARPETREWAQTWPDPESPRRQPDPVPTETSTPAPAPAPARPPPGPGSPRIPSGPYLPGPAEGSAARSYALSSQASPRELCCRPPGSPVPNFGMQTLGSAGCELRAGPGRRDWDGHPTQSAPKNLWVLGKGKSPRSKFKGTFRDVAKLDAGPPLSPPLRAVAAGGAGSGAPADAGTPRHSARPAWTRSRPAAAPTRGRGRRACPAPKLLP